MPIIDVARSEATGEIISILCAHTDGDWWYTLSAWTITLIGGETK